ncbi:hypothetical protein BWI93_11920 [Siphonobacter sp. BAB-5385]|uniref:sensor histidine kinase n=1 Tax=Siphonobacter sp. BAB-5385 TaxID=1864822 RepID=UPI000B9E0732|nr:sensor histidine kinase [Siphonobacter sp. BAB-5385]OZI07961.1 hypothetical protein BWI93_11920 [Siphonobacter sp. BAB-5385]
MPFPQSRNLRLRLLGPIGLFAFGLIFFKLRMYLELTPRDFFWSMLIGLFCGYIGWELARWVVRFIQKLYPGLINTRRRLWRLLFVIILLANVNTFLRSGVNQLLNPGLWLYDLYDYFETVGIQVVYVCVYVSIYEGSYLIHQWKQTYQEKEQLMRAEWQARFDSLKSQVNPHFLFNALNALSSLIEESPQLAGRFVDELSKVYRYLLYANDRELTTLETELRFIESYVHLLQTRHGEGIRVQLSVPIEHLNYTLPPLTLQLLVENAVKHNVVRASQPLTIDISTAFTRPSEVQLWVRNNVQRKNKAVVSNGVGLNNITAKYRMLTQSDIVIREEADSFTVVLPLLSHLN